MEQQPSEEHDAQQPHVDEQHVPKPESSSEYEGAETREPTGKL